MKTRYVSPEEYRNMTLGERAVLQATALITADKWVDSKGTPTQIFTFLPTRQVFMKVGDNLTSRYSQEDFAQMRGRAFKTVGEMFMTLCAPRKGKGIMAKKHAARVLFCSIVGELEEGKV